MFVVINNKNMNIHDVDKWIRTARDDNGGLISPEFAMEILSKTNHLAHIKKVLSNIKEKCDTPEKIASYREFILSCVDGREMSDIALTDLREMVDLCGCSKEFDAANEKLKIYGKFDCDNVVIVKSIEEFKALEGENLRVYFDADDVDLSYFDLSKIGSIKFRDGAEVRFVMSKNLPKCLDVSMCSVVTLSHCDLEGLNLKFREGAEVDLFSAKNLPKDLDVSQCSLVDLRFCDLDGLNLKFREGARVYLYEAYNLPKDLDVSMCSYVSLAYCYVEGLNLKFKEGAEVDLSHVENLPKDLDVSIFSMVNLGFLDLEGLNLKFREGAKVHLAGAKNLPKDLDVSMCSLVNLSDCNVEGLNLKFREGAEVNLGGAENLPEVLDFSMCDEVHLYHSDLSGIKEIKFREGAEVDLGDAYNLPKVLDLSMCSKVNLTGCDLSGVKKIKFKNKEQEKKFMEGYRNFEGKIVYADEDKKEKEDSSLFSRIRKRFASGGMGE